MSGQYHFEKKQSPRESRVGQDADFFLQEWETMAYQSDVSNELLEGKIIARMPDLGESKTIRLPSARKFTSRIYSGLIFCSYLPGRTIRSLRAKSRSVSFFEKRNFLHRMIVAGLILIFIGGGIWIHKSNRKKAQKLASQVALQNVELEKQIKTEDTAQVTPAAPVQVTPPATVVAEKQITPVTPPAPKPAEPVAEKTIAKPAEKVADQVTVSVVAPVVPVAPKVDDKKSNVNNNSPWDRPVTDNYSPWTMNSPDRQQSHSMTLGTEQAGITTKPVPSNPSANSTVPMAPMTPITTYSSETVPNVAVNNPPITMPYAIGSNPVASNGTVTIYSQQQNVPIPQNYAPNYGRTENYAPVTQGPIQSYPPQPNIVQTNTIPHGQPIPIQVIQQQYPTQYPAQYSAQYPPPTSYPPTPQGTQGVNYGAGGQPIPQNVVVSQPYPMAPVQQQNYYPQPNPTTYQQGNYPSPYRRLY